MGLKYFLFITKHLYYVYVKFCYHKASEYKDLFIFHPFSGKAYF